jgi:RimJ/RimL family protein N-acetyltransferase
VSDIILKSCKLRRLKPTDLNAYHKNINDKVLGRNMRNIDYPISMQEAKKHIRELIQKNNSKPKTFDLFVISVDKECAGIISIGQMTINHKAKIGYWLGHKYRGRGIMTECVRYLTKYWFQRFNLHRIDANVVTFNKASAKVLKKCGYKLEGIQKKFRYKNGRYDDDYLFAITR